MVIKMRKIKILIILFLFSVMGFNKNVLPFKYFQYQLDNGLKIILVPNIGKNIVSYYSIVMTGSRDEWEEGKSGFAHFFEHMMFRGTEKYPNYDEIIASIGADANAWTSDDQTVYHINLTNNYLEQIIDLEADRFQNLKYSEADFKTEAGAVYGEFNKGRTSPFSILNEELLNLAFEKHTYKHTVIGFEDDIKNMPNQYEYSISFHKRYYRPENVVLLIVGDFDKDKTIELIKKYYSNWQPGYVKPNISKEPEQKVFKEKTVQYNGKTLPILALAYKSDSFDPMNKDVVAAKVLEEYLFGQTSTLYNKLVLDEQKVQSLYADFAANKDPKLLTIIARVKKQDDIEYVKKSIISEIEKTKTIKIPQENLKNIKSRLKYEFLMSLTSPDRIASSLTYYISLRGKIEDIDKYFETLENISQSDVINAAKRYFNENKLTQIILVGKK